MDNGNEQTTSIMPVQGFKKQFVMLYWTRYGRKMAFMEGTRKFTLGFYKIEIKVILWLDYINIFGINILIFVLWVCY